MFQLHAGSFNTSSRGSMFIAPKLSRKLRWDIFLKASVEYICYLLFQIHFLEFPHASVKASVETISFNEIIRESFGESFRGRNSTSTKASVKTSVRASVEQKLFDKRFRESFHESFP